MSAVSTTRSEDATTGPASGSSPARKYHTGLDGVRAIAIVAVLLFHLGLERFGGGFLGVDVFFTLSGFLITGIVLEELDRTGGLRFGNFYLRRARRLLPAVAVMLLVCGVLVLLFARDAAHQFGTDARAAALYVTNWWYVADARDYFSEIGRPPLLQHLWSLAVEEQFYLVWPLIAYGAYRWGGRTRVASVAAIGAVASTLLMAAIAIGSDVPATHDSARIYYGTDTHASTLLVGAVLAVLWTNPVRERLASTGRRLVDVVGLIGLVGLALCFTLTTDAAAWLFRGGFLLVGLLSTAVIAAAAVDGSRVAAALSWAPLRYLGLRSYGIYIWHWPIFELTRPELDVPLRGLPAMTLSVALTLLAAELSYRFVEMPVRHGALARMLRDTTPREWFGRRWFGRGWSPRTVGLAGGVTAVLTAFVLAVGLAATPAPDASRYLGGLTAVGAEPLTPATATPASKPGTRPPGITAVGDSVMLGSRDALKAVMKGITIDAAIARQPEAIFGRVAARSKAGKLGGVVIVTAGANGYASKDELVAMIDAIRKDRRIVLVTSTTGKQWVTRTNRNMRNAAQGRNEVRVVDWAAISKGHRKYFYPDGAHLRPVGAAAYAAAIAKATR